MNKFIVLDDVFDEPTNKALAEFDYGAGETWYDLGALPLHEKILNICREHFDLKNIVGYEMWRNKGQLGWHIDKDEKLFKETRAKVFPQCSAVYYAFAENVHGGEFATDDITCMPQTNRLLLFSPGVAHSVSAFTGKRIAISLNPWDHRV
jgi:hypothetical protein